MISHLKPIPLRTFQISANMLIKILMSSWSPLFLSQLTSNPSTKPVNSLCKIDSFQPALIWICATKSYVI